MKERDRLAALGEMAAGLAHEIRNPLGAIKGAAQFLVPQGRGDDDEWLQVIVEEVDRLNGVVTQFLDYSRPLKSTPAPTDVNDVLERTAKLVRAELPASVELVLDLGARLPRVQTDAEQLKQVLINLFRNAVQAMPGGGKIFVATSIPDEGLRLLRPPDTVELRVRDTGPGIPEEHRENIFVPFFTTKEKGTGLGLAICQRLIRHHGGSISLLARPPGEGAEFVIRLPAVIEEPVAFPEVAVRGT
jgi:signal transduction histidine kinase